MQFINSIPDMASSNIKDWQMVRHPGIFEKIMWGTIIQRWIERSWKIYYPSDQLISRAIFLGKHRFKILLIFQRSIVLETRGILTLDVLWRLADRVKGMMNKYIGNLSVITCAASLAHHGMFGSVQKLEL